MPYQKRKKKKMDCEVQRWAPRIVTDCQSRKPGCVFKVIEKLELEKVET